MNKQLQNKTLSQINIIMNRSNSLQMKQKINIKYKNNNKNRAFKSIIIYNKMIYNQMKKTEKVYKTMTRLSLITKNQLININSYFRKIQKKSQRLIKLKFLNQGKV